MLFETTALIAMTRPEFRHLADASAYRVLVTLAARLRVVHRP